MVCVCCRTGAKLAIGGGAMYLTVNQGVWSTGTEGSTALNRFKTTVVPTATDYMQNVMSHTIVMMFLLPPGHQPLADFILQNGLKNLTLSYV